MRYSEIGIIGVPEDIYVSLCTYFAILTSVTLATITFCHILCSSLNSSYNGSNTMPKSVYVSFLCIVFAVLQQVALFEFIPNCQVIKHLSFPFYALFKLSFYIVLILRVHELFGSPPLGYSKKKLIIWVIFLIAWSLFNWLVFILTTTTSTYDKDAISFLECKLDALPQLFLSVALLDLTASIVNTYLFIRPIFRLNKMLKNRPDERNVDKTLQMKNIGIKQLILTIIGIFTTWFALFNGIMFYMPQVFLPLDTNITIIVCILMYKWNSLFFEFLCCCCVLKKQKSRTIARNSVEQLQMVAHTSSAKSQQHNQGIIIH
eukprot:27241_1